MTNERYVHNLLLAGIGGKVSKPVIFFLNCARNQISGALIMYKLSVSKYISAAHQLNEYDGPCARIHGHNWKIQIDVQAEILSKTGIAIDFNDLERWLWQIIGPFDHQLINTMTPFDHLNPTAENLVKYIFEEMKKKLPEGARLARVSAWETDSCMVSYEE